VDRADLHDFLSRLRERGQSISTAEGLVRLDVVAECFGLAELRSEHDKDVFHERRLRRHCVVWYAAGFL